jgi:hypothetical protein
MATFLMPTIVHLFCLKLPLLVCPHRVALLQTFSQMVMVFIKQLLNMKVVGQWSPLCQIHNLSSLPLKQATPQGLQWKQVVITTGHPQVVGGRTILLPSQTPTCSKGLGKGKGYLSGRKPANLSVPNRVTHRVVAHTHERTQKEIQL